MFGNQWRRSPAKPMAQTCDVFIDMRCLHRHAKSSQTCNIYTNMQCLRRHAKSLSIRQKAPHAYRGTSLMRNSNPPGPYSKSTSRALRQSKRGGQFLMSGVPCTAHPHEYTVLGQPHKQIPISVQILFIYDSDVFFLQFTSRF